MKSYIARSYSAKKLISIHRGKVKRSYAMSVRDSCAGTRRQQPLRQLRIIVLDSPVQRGCSVRISHVRIGLLRQLRFRGTRVAVLDGIEQCPRLAGERHNYRLEQPNGDDVEGGTTNSKRECHFLNSEF